MRFSSVGGTGLFKRGAWRSTELSSALMARWISISWGGLLARVGKKPSRARPRPPIARTRMVTTIPRMKLRILDPRSFELRQSSRANFSHAPNHFHSTFNDPATEPTHPLHQIGDVSKRADGEPHAPDRKSSAEKILLAEERTEPACRATLAEQ